MGADPLDAVVFFRRAEQLFADYKIPPEFQAKVISPFISARAKAILSKLSPDQNQMVYNNRLCESCSACGSGSMVDL